MPDETDTGTLPGWLTERVPDPLTRYLPSVKESGKYTGPLSTFAEYHAVGVGFALGPRSGEVLAAYGAGSGAGKCRRSGHLTDAWKEMAYVGVGAGLHALVFGGL